jgi:hypothetical protein
MKPRVYIETTIVSYLTARPSRDVIRLSHEMLTRKWWDKRRADFDMFTSDLVMIEASAGDPQAAAERLKVLADIPRLLPKQPATTLAQQVERALALPVRARADALHVSIAAVNHMDFLLTWNCRHLANAALAAKIERACADAGFVAPRIATPESLLEPT